METKEGTSCIHQISGEKMLCLFLKRHLQLLPFMNGWPVLLTSVCTVTVTSPNGQTVYASENEHITAQCVYSTEGCSDLYYVEWCFGSDCSESIVQIGSTTIWQNGYDSEFILIDSTSLVIPVTSSRNNQVYTCSVLYDFALAVGRNSLTVTIIVPPSITHHPSSMSPNEGTSSVTLSCQADGDPTSTFTWTKDGSTLQTNSKYTVTGGSLVIHNIVRSDDGEYRCVADNGYGTAATSNPATLTVNYPPGEPTCTRSPSPHSGTPSYYLLNTGVTLTCEVTDGKPTATVQWYKNEESSPLPPSHSVNGNTIERTYDFYIGKSDNTATYTCKATNTALSNPLECELTFTVYFPPTSVTISGYSSPRKEDETLTLTCTTGSSNPAAEISWYKNGSPWNSGNGESTNTVQDSNGEHNGKERTQELNIILKPSHNGARYQCKAKNSYYSTNQVQSAIKEITVYFKPSSVTLTGYTNPVKSGDVLILVCQTESSNPHADISWFKDDVSLTSTPTETIKTFTTSGSHNGGEKTRQELHITLSQSHNGVQFQCHARNSQFAMNTNVESANQGINVYFPPLSVSLSADKFNPVQEDTTLTLTCTTESSNPVATISWYKNGVLWSPSDGETLRSAEQSNGINGGKVTTQQLIIILTPYHNQDTYTCIGRNDQFNDDGVESNEILLSVYYSPYVVNATENSRSAANEGDPALLICEVNCNPEATFKWYKDGNEVVDRKLSTIETKEGSVFKSKLLIPFTERSDHGIYTCQAVNEIGNVNFSITLEAKSKPEAPVDIELLSRSYDSLTIEIIPGFHGGEPDNTMYYVEYSESTQSDWLPWPSNGQGSRERQLSITGLMENTLYVLKARAGNSLGIGFYSTENMFQTYGKPVVNFDVKSGILSWTLYENPDFVCIKVEVLVDTGDWLVENDCVDPAITEYTVNHKTATYRIVYCKLHGICDQSQFYATSEVKNGKSSNTGLLAGTITTVIVVIAVVVLLVILLKRRHDKNKRGEDTELTGVELEAKPYEVIRPKDLKDDDIEVQYEDISKEHKKSQLRSEKVDLKVLSDETSYADLSTTRAEGMYMKLGEKALEFPKNNLKVDSIIYNGMFHRIAKGKALNIGGKEGIIKVAIKMSRDDNIGNNEGDILNEIELLKSMSGHPNIINLLGYCTKTAPHYLIMPYFTFGNLKVFMKDNRQFVCGDPGGISSRQLLSFVCDVAKGMEYLSDNNVVHRYLAAEHVMVENSLTCKISQFGYASNAVDVARLYEKMQDKTPNGWMAPESILKKEFSTCSDVWSFAVVVWEIVSLGLTPFEGIGQASIASKIKKGSTLPRQNQCGPELNDMMVSCWNRKPEHRPTFHALVDIVKGFVNDGKEHIDIQRIVESEYASVI
ncbi:uncharacterized protein LOC144440250 isoform X2 [Glandiceps talaboti]